jgi:uncharacterized DUF497 family protein
VMELIFEWNAKKARANQRKHRISFEEAKTVFGDPLELMIPDPEHSYDEERSISIGESENGTLLLISYTQVENVIRLISAREAESYEIAQYRQRRGAK